MGDVVNKDVLFKTSDFTVPPILSSIEDHASLTVLYGIRDYFLNPFSYDRDDIRLNEELHDYFNSGLTTHWERKEVAALIRAVELLITSELAHKDYDEIFIQIGYIEHMEFYYDRRLNFTQWRLRTRGV